MNHELKKEIIEKLFPNFKSTPEDIEKNIHPEI